MINARNTWSHWLNSHKTREAYDKNPGKVKDFLTGTDGVGKFKKLTLCKNLVVLSKQAMGEKLQATFLHSIVGVPIFTEEMRYVARSGLKYGTGIEIDPKTMFRSTPSINVPSIVQLMKISSGEEFRNLSQDGDQNKKKIKGYAILTPNIAEALQKCDMTPEKAFLGTLEAIKANFVDTEQGETPEEDEDQILGRMGAQYEQVLMFLWACHYSPLDIPVPTVSPLQDEMTLTWETETRDLIDPHPNTPTQEVQANGNRTDLQMPDMQAGASEAMTKLADSLVRYQEATLKSNKEKEDRRIKAWRKLPQIQQNIILLAGMDKEMNVPTEATDEMLSILGCQNGAQVEQLLRQSMGEHNMRLEPGLCTALNKGIFASPNDAGTPRNFTPFFTPPIENFMEEEENSHLLKLAIQEKFDSQDILSLTKMEVKVPMKAQDLRHHLKNFAGIAGRCFGETALLYENLSKVCKHIERREPSYNYEFVQNKMFGGHLLDKINWRTHRFLDSCAGGELESIDAGMIDFSDILYQIDRREYHAITPVWLNKFINKRERKPQVEGEFKNGHKKRRQFKGEGDEKMRRIANHDIKIEHRLRPDEQYGLIFHPGNLKDLEKPKRKNGDPICLRFHTVGFCYSDCFVKEGHGKLSEEEGTRLQEFTKKARAARGEFQAKRNNLEKPNGPPNTNKQNKGEN